MTEIPNWEEKKLDLSYVIILIFILITATILNFKLKDELENAIDYFFILIFIGATLGLFLIFIYKNEYYGKFIMLIVALVTVIYILIIEDFFLMVILFIPMIVLFTVISFYVTRQTSISISIKKPFSFILYQHLIKNIKSEFENRKYNFSMNGNIFAITFNSKFKGKFWIWVEEDKGQTLYKIILSTKYKDYIKYDLKNNIRNLIIKLNAEHDFNDYHGDEKYQCKICNRKASFIPSSNQFFCEKCSKTYNENKIKIILKDEE